MASPALLKRWIAAGESRPSGTDGVHAVLLCERCQNIHQLGDAACRQRLAAVDERFVVVDASLRLREFLTARAGGEDLRNGGLVDVAQRLEDQMPIELHGELLSGSLCK